jgi:RNA polymerase sigma factor (sigma-70 family)
MENDRELINKILDGDRTAFASLLSQYQSYVFTVCFRVLKNREEAEEAAQDTFIKVYKTIKTFKQDSKFSTWLYSVAFRTAIDHSRKKKMKISSIDSEDNFLQIKDNKSTPMELMANKDLKTVLASVIQTLPQTEASVITLYYQGEQTVKEIAKTLKLSESNVKIKLYRTREALKNKLSYYLRAEIHDLI